MFNAIRKFMQANDRNGDWLTATPQESAYLLETLSAWAEDGLDITPKVDAYFGYLKEIAALVVFLEGGVELTEEVEMYVFTTEDGKTLEVVPCPAGFAVMLNDRQIGGFEI